MSNTKKLLSIVLAFVFMFNVIAISTSANLGDGNMLSADVNLEVGTMSGGIFTPLALGQTLAVNDVITVRISPETDFYTGVARFAVMFSSAYFTLVGSGVGAFTMNTANPFVQQAVPVNGFAAATNVPVNAWPPSLQSQFAIYKAVCVNNQANSNAANGGYPLFMPGDWIFSFNLTVSQNITAGSGARIWMDTSWFRNPSYTTSAAYFTKCTGPDQLSASGSSTIYNFDIDLSGADLTLPFVNLSTISFDSAGGTDVAPISGEVSSAVTPPAYPTREGYDFTTWAPPLPSIFPEDDATVTAGWAKHLYNATFNVDNSPVAAVPTYFEAAIVLPPNPVKPGFDFTRWEPAVPATMPANDLTFNAVFTPKKFLITFNANGGTGGTSTSLDYNSPLSAPPVSRNLYTLNRWDPTVPATVPMADTVYTAQWTINKTTISFNSNGGSAVAPITGDIYSPVTPPANPSKTGSTFSVWSPALPATFPESNLTVTAQWTLNIYDAVFTVDGTEYTRVPTAFGAQIVPPADPQKEGFNFTGWSPIPGTMGAGNQTFEAVFVNAVTDVMITLDGNDIGESHAVKVPLFKTFSSMPLQLGYETAVENPARVEFISSGKNVSVDETGLVTCSGNVGRSSDITINIYDAGDTIIATDTVHVVFYKFTLEIFVNIIEKLLNLFKL